MFESWFVMTLSRWFLTFWVVFIIVVHFVSAVGSPWVCPEFSVQITQIPYWWRTTERGTWSVPTVALLWVSMCSKAEDLYLFASLCRWAGLFVYRVSIWGLGVCSYIKLSAVWGAERFFNESCEGRACQVTEERRCLLGALLLPPRVQLAALEMNVSFLPHIRK